jgi:hypothetical protein
MLLLAGPGDAPGPQAAVDASADASAAFLSESGKLQTPLLPNGNGSGAGRPVAVEAHCSAASTAEQHPPLQPQPPTPLHLPFLDTLAMGNTASAQAFDNTLRYVWSKHVRAQQQQDHGRRASQGWLATAAAAAAAMPGGGAGTGLSTTQQGGRLGGGENHLRRRTTVDRASIATGLLARLKRFTPVYSTRPSPLSVAMSVGREKRAEGTGVCFSCATHIAGPAGTAHTAPHAKWPPSGTGEGKEALRAAQAEWEAMAARAEQVALTARAGGPLRLPLVAARQAQGDASGGGGGENGFVGFGTGQRAGGGAGSGAYDVPVDVVARVGGRPVAVLCHGNEDYALVAAAAQDKPSGCAALPSAQLAGGIGADRQAAQLVVDDPRRGCGPLLFASPYGLALLGASRWRVAVLQRHAAAAAPTAAPPSPTEPGRCDGHGGIQSEHKATSLLLACVSGTDWAGLMQLEAAAAAAMIEREQANGRNPQRLPPSGPSDLKDEGLDPADLPLGPGPGARAPPSLASAAINPGAWVAAAAAELLAHRLPIDGRAGRG